MPRVQPMSLCYSVWLAGIGKKNSQSVESSRVLHREGNFARQSVRRSNLRKIDWEIGGTANLLVLSILKASLVPRQTHICPTKPQTCGPWGEKL